MRCGDLMTSRVLTCRNTDTVGQCAWVMKSNNIGFVPIVDHEGRVRGVVTDRDLVVRVVAAGKASTTLVSDAMTTKVISCTPNDELRTAERRMSDARISRLVIVGARDHCLGIVSLSDIIRVEESARAGQVLRSIASREANPPPTLR